MSIQINSLPTVEALLEMGIDGIFEADKGFFKLVDTVYHNNKSCRDGRGKDGGLTRAQTGIALVLGRAKCIVSGKPLVSSRGIFCGSLDRMKSDYRYHVMNVWFVHRDFNLGKGDSDYKDPDLFEAFLETSLGITVDQYYDKAQKFANIFDAVCKKLGHDFDRPLAKVDRTNLGKKK